jgi:hypothetical protein
MKNIYLCIILCVFISCGTKDPYALLIKKYSASPADSLKLQAVSFLKENSNDMTAEIPVFFEQGTGKEVDIRLDTITSEESLLCILQKHKLLYASKVIPEMEAVNTRFLEQQIEMAFSVWNKYPWSMNISKEVFFNYLLPYKVYGEKPENWRSYFASKYNKAKIDSLISNPIWNKHPDWVISEKNPPLSKVVAYLSIMDAYNTSKIFSYGYPSIHFSHYPSISELLAFKKGSCLGGSYFSTYLFRSIGIPSTVDIVPEWGSRNGNHATSVFWRTNDSIAKALDHTPAKVLRYCFKKQKTWSDSIKPFVNEKTFMLDLLKHDHWLDVTHEHTQTTDITYKFENKANLPKFAYLCVYDYGSWNPIWWGKIVKNNVVFKNMGKDILYHIALPKDTGFNLVGRPFLLNSLGATNYFNPENKILQKLILKRINKGKEAYIKKADKYSLLYLDEKNNWNLVATKRCKQDSLITFSAVPHNAVYLLKRLSATTRMERPFIYIEGKQIWY